MHSKNLSHKHTHTQTHTHTHTKEKSAVKHISEFANSTQICSSNNKILTNITVDYVARGVARKLSWYLYSSPSLH